MILSGHNLVVMGVDPGLRFLGVGIIAEQQGEWSYLSHDVIVLSDKISIAEKLCQISQKIAEYLKMYQPQVLGLERAFLGKNADSAFKLGLARGVVMAESARQNVKVLELAARSVKKAVTGYGNADKETVALYVQKWLKIKLQDRLDATDALALALFAAMSCGKDSLLSSRGVEV